MNKGTGLTGLVNLGNTCFMNSAIQCLSHTTELTQYFLTEAYKNNINKKSKRINVLEQWARLINGMWDSNCIVSPNSFNRTIRILAAENGLSNFTGFSQNDVEEFLIFFIDSLHDALLREVTIHISGKVVNDIDKMAIESMKTWKNYFKNNYSKIIELFYSQLVSSISSDGDVLSRTYDPVCFISLPIPADVKSPSIIDCFNLFTSDEILDDDNKYQHPKTKEYVNATKNVKFWSLPTVLLISFKRFNNSRHKISKVIDFPIHNLDLSDYCLGYDKHKQKFDLFGICNHSGGSGGGHYYSYCKTADSNEWYNFNDTHVSKMNDESQLITSEAYVLFYRKQ